MATRSSTRLRLQRWLQEHEITLHPSLALDETSIICRELIEPKTTVARIPKRAVLSEKTTSAALKRLDAFGFELAPQIRLTVVLLHEQSLGAGSPWYDYLASLPTEPVPIAPLWPAQGEARKWARGTVLEKRLQQSDLSLPNLEQVYNLVVRPFFPSSPPSFRQFLLAYSIISSRAFQGDQWHGLSLVPLADIFNHSDDHHVDFRSEMWVCAECGSFDVCEHDGEGAERVGVQPTPEQAKEDDMCELVSVARIEAGGEVFNTYGDLSNADLLIYYGFALQANKHDLIAFAPMAISLLSPIPPPNNVLVENWGDVLNAWWDGQWPMEAEDDVDSPIADPRNLTLHLDADGRLSRRLWLLIISLHIPLPSSRAKRRAFLLRLDRLQTARHAGLEQEEKADPMTERALRVLAEAIQALCAWVVAGQREPSKSGAQLLEIAAAETDEPTRMAIELLASERLLLAVVSQTWHDISQPSSS